MNKFRCLENMIKTNLTCTQDFATGNKNNLLKISFELRVFVILATATNVQRYIQI